MSQEISECRECNRAGREYYRAEMHRLTTLNGPEKIIIAMGVTKGIFTGLVPFQPVDFRPLQQHLEQVGFSVGREDEYAINQAVDVLTSAYLLDKRRWHQILSEWEVKT